MPWDRELYVLEEAIRRLGAEYDAFFYGSVSKPPVESRKHVEQMIRQLGGMAADSAADRYRFSTLQGRYNALCDRWERLQEEKEAGRRPGLYGHFTDGGRNPPLPRPPPPPASLPVKLECRVAGRGLEDGIPREIRERRAPQVRVEEDPRRVDRAPERRRKAPRQRLLRAREEGCAFRLA